MQQKRKKIQESIQDLNKKRNEYVAKERIKLQAAGEETLDTVMIKTLRKQLQKKQYECEK